MDAILNSNRGYESLSLKSVRQCEDSVGILCEVHVRSSSWGESEPRVIGADLGAVCISRDEVETLITELEEWLAPPLSEIAKNSLDSHTRLGFTDSAALDLVFGQRTDVISDGKPVVTIRWQINSFQGESHFVTDPSCLSSFAKDLRAIVEE